MSPQTIWIKAGQSVKNVSRPGPIALGSGSLRSPSEAASMVAGRGPVRRNWRASIKMACRAWVDSEGYRRWLADEKTRSGNSQGKIGHAKPRQRIPAGTSFSALRNWHLFVYIPALSVRGEGPLNRPAPTLLVRAGAFVAPVQSKRGKNGHHEYFVVDRRLRGARDPLRHLGDSIGAERRFRQQADAGNFRGRARGRAGLSQTAIRHHSDRRRGGFRDHRVHARLAGRNRLRCRRE